ncbi:hypothetical protein V494_04664 [Pseudogymnoascus sp. VKM F-4513 (FW-928)]|nr:hypothetical protein V494_04664 [Pseudogymnoascus sp. VKM F-4513 (FW-928)]
MASYFQGAVKTVASYLPGKARPGYEPILNEDGDVEPTRQRAAEEEAPSTARQRAAKIIVTIGLICLTFLIILAAVVVWARSRPGDHTLPCKRTVAGEINNGYQCHPEISHHWGQYSPYFTVPSEISADTPASCDITFVQVLARHGARYPTYTKSILYKKLAAHIVTTVGNIEGRLDQQYEFLRSYEWRSGADKLTIVGVQQLSMLGYKHYQRYQSLAKDTIPFIRTTDQDRMLASALFFVDGFETARRKDPEHTGPDYDEGYPIIPIPEDPSFNNTLSRGLCDAFESGPFSHGGLDAQAVFAATFVPPIQARINEDLKGVNLTSREIIYLMDMCPFATVDPNKVPSQYEAPLSPFCHLFTTAEWRSYDYYQSLGKFYGFAQGNPMGPTQGVGFANELIARLTGKPVIDHTSTNSTLDKSKKMFPLDKNTTMFADFSHDNDMMSIYAALGLLNATKALDKENLQDLDDTKGYSASRVVPFGARSYFEKMRCGGRDEELVRVLINDRVIPLQNCGADSLGRCKLDAFIESLTFPRHDGHWDQCFE